MQERFLEDINSLLNSGEIPNLFSNEDWQEVSTDLKLMAKEQNLEESRENMVYIMNRQVMKNLRILLSCSPVGNQFKMRCREVNS